MAQKIAAVVVPVATVEDVPEDAQSIHHHHDHEHHHHHSHYERMVDEDGTVKETTVTEEIIEQPKASATATAVAAAAAAAVATAEGGASKKKKNKKAKETVVEERDKVVEETVIVPPAQPISTIAAPTVVETHRTSTVVAEPATVATAVPVPTVDAASIISIPRSRQASPVLTTKTVTTTTKIIEAVHSSNKAPSVKAPSVRAPSIRDPFVRAPSVVANTIPVAPAPAPAPTVIAPVIIEPPLPPTALAPASPTPSHHSHRSHRSHRSHHHPEIIVNVNVPTATPIAPVAPVVAPTEAVPTIPVATATDAVPVIAAPTLAPAATIIAPSPVRAAAAPLPLSIPSAPPSPARSVRSMRLPKIFRSEPKESQPIYVQAIPEEPGVIETQVGDQVVTKVVTTTTTTHRAPTPPKTPSPVPRMAQLAYPPPPPGMSYVVNDPTYVLPPRPQSPSIRATTTLPVPPVAPPTPITPAPIHSREGSPSRFIETTTVETVTYPLSVDTGATTVGNPTTKGIGAPRSVALTQSSGRVAGTKGGLRPIPIVDYAALVRATPPQRKLALTALPPPTILPPEGPQTILTMSADLERDSKGNEHLHATVRDHTNVRKSSPPVIAHDSKTLAPDDAISKVAEKKEVKRSKQREKHKQLEKEIEEEIQSVVEDIMEKVDKRDKKDKRKNKEPIYRTLGGTGLAAPKSERYAYPPPETVIEQNARNRFTERMGMGQAPPPGLQGVMPGLSGIPGMPGMVIPGMRNSPSQYQGYQRGMPPPGPMLMPRPPPLMGGRPGMFGPPLVNPLMMQPGGMGGMSLMGAPMPQMGMPYAPVPGMGMGGVFGGSQLGWGRR